MTPGPAGRRPRARRRAAPVAVAGLALVLAAAGCGITDDTASTTGTTRAPLVSTTLPGATTTLPPPLAVPTLEGVALRTELITEIYEPVAFSPRTGTETLYVAQKDGKIKQIRAEIQYNRDGSERGSVYRLDINPILDIGRSTQDEGERGLLGLAFSSDGRRMYLMYTAAKSGNITVDEYTMNEDSVDRSTRRNLLDIEHPNPNHNGGQLALGPDGFLYIGMGDGGGEGDPDNHAQDPHSLYGKILRIDPEGATKDAAYDAPAGNPYHDGVNGAPEVWALGLRNPWRFSFDRFTKDLWIGDVGQGAWEEIDLAPNAVGGAGRTVNFGWRVFEGSRPYNGAAPIPGAAAPVFEYGHDAGGCAVVGGYSYRGAAIPALQGVYVYADYCLGEVRGFLRHADGTNEDIGFGITVPKGALESNGAITSFGEDHKGELYVLSAAGGVYKIVPA